MSTEIRLIYTATTALVDPSRANLEQTLTIDANQDDPPLPFVAGKQQLSRRGMRVATVVHGRWRTGSISTPYITAQERPFWREYIESTAEQEPHVLEHPDFAGWDPDVNRLLILRPLNTMNFSRFNLEDAYRASFQWREIV